MYSIMDIFGGVSWIELHNDGAERSKKGVGVWGGGDILTTFSSVCVLYI